MPYWKCKDCHHEWEQTKSVSCNWCGANDPIILEKQTPLEKMIFSKRRRDDL